MGPAGWAAVARCMAFALGSALFGGKNNIASILMRHIHREIMNNNFEAANGLLRDLACREREVYEEFLEKYGNQMSPDVLEELKKILD